MTINKTNYLLRIYFLFSIPTILFSSCVGYIYTINDTPGKTYYMSKDNNISAYVSSTHTSNKSKSLNLTMEYYLDGEYTVNPDLFELDVLYPENYKEITPSIKIKEGILRKNQSESINVKDKKTVVVQFTIESDREFELTSIEIDVLPTKFITKNGGKAITDTLKITSIKLAY